MLSEVRVSYQAVHGLPYIPYRSETIIRNCRADSQITKPQTQRKTATVSVCLEERGMEGSMGRGKGEGEKKKRGRGRRGSSAERERSRPRNAAAPILELGQWKHSAGRLA